MKDQAPNIKAVRAEPGRRLVITWKGGAESWVDVGRHIAEYAIFAPLRDDDALFGRVDVGDWGWCVRWSDEMEISSDTLWRLALEQGGAWLRAWRARRGLDDAAAAKALGVSARLWRQCEAGLQPLPKTLRLAAIGLDAQEAA